LIAQADPPRASGAFVTELVANGRIKLKSGVILEHINAAVGDFDRQALGDAIRPGWAYDRWPRPPGTVMSDPEFAVLRRHMIAQIAARTIFLTSRLGKASLDRRVLDVMGKVPRHDFVRVELQPLLTTTCPCPAAIARRSRSRSSSP
jgi:hypothetical protein